MKGYEDELIRIKKLLRENPKGLTISDISADLGISRNAVAKYMDILTISGQVEKQTFGPAKVFFPSNRIPMSAMVDITSDLIMVFDKDMRIVQANEGILRLLGKIREDVIGHDLVSVPLPLSCGFEPAVAVQKALDGNGSSEQVCSGEGEGEQFFNIKVMPTTFEDGTPGVTMIIEDVTETKLMEKSLRSNEESLNNLLNSLDDFLFVTDLDLKMLHVNDAVIKRLGYWRSELVGQSICMVHPPGLREQAMSEMQAIMEGNASISTVPLMAHDGGMIPVETKMVRGTWDERPVNFGIAKEVSQLRLAEEMFSRAFELSPLATIISTLDEGRIIRVNGAFVQMSGYSRDEAIGSTISDLDLYADPNPSASMTAELSGSGRIVDMAITLQGKDGGRREGLLSAVSIGYSQASCALSVIVDITDRKRLECELAEARRATS